MVGALRQKAPVHIQDVHLIGSRNLNVAGDKHFEPACNTKTPINYHNNYTRTSSAELGGAFSRFSKERPRSYIWDFEDERNRDFRYPDFDDGRNRDPGSLRISLRKVLHTVFIMIS